MLPEGSMQLLAVGDAGPMSASNGTWLTPSGKTWVAKPYVEPEAGAMSGSGGGTNFGGGRGGSGGGPGRGPGAPNANGPSLQKFALRVSWTNAADPPKYLLQIEGARSSQFQVAKSLDGRDDVIVVTGDVIAGEPAAISVALSATDWIPLASGKPAATTRPAADNRAAMIEPLRIGREGRVEAGAVVNMRGEMRVIAVMLDGTEHGFRGELRQSEPAKGMTRVVAATSGITIDTIDTIRVECRPFDHVIRFVGVATAKGGPAHPAAVADGK